jgi:hypothetical protein
MTFEESFLNLRRKMGSEKKVFFVVLFGLDLLTRFHLHPFTWIFKANHPQSLPSYLQDCIPSQV